MNKNNKKKSEQVFRTPVNKSPERSKGKKFNAGGFERARKKHFGIS